MRRKLVSKSFREDIGKIVVLIWDIGFAEVIGGRNLNIGGSRRGSS
jgi:hypothetical protein